MIKMKKTYINPETIVVQLMPTTVLAASTDNITISGNSGNATFVENGTPTGDVLTKENVNVWDEEW